MKDKSSTSLADEMLRHAREESLAIEADREEILRAFIAKFGFDPENTIQVECKDNGKRSWQVIHFSDADVVKVRRTLLISRISKQPLTLWQKICVWMAGGKWAK